MNIIKQIEKGKTELWLHEDQKTGYIQGEKLYKYLQDNNMLDSCASEDDLKEIQKEGVEFFRKHFKGKYVHAWKNLVRNRDGGLVVPYLFGSGGEVILRWRWAGYDWLDSNPGLRHASSKTSKPKTSLSSDLSPLSEDEPYVGDTGTPDKVDFPPITHHCSKCGHGMEITLQVKE